MVRGLPRRKTEGSKSLAVVFNVSPRLTTVEGSMKLQQVSKELIATVLTEIHSDAFDICVCNDVSYPEALTKVFHELWTRLETES